MEISYFVSHWPSDHMTSSRPLIGQPDPPTPPPQYFFLFMKCLSYSVKGLLSTGPNLSIFFIFFLRESYFLCYLVFFSIKSLPFVLRYEQQLVEEEKIQSVQSIFQQYYHNYSGISWKVFWHLIIYHNGHEFLPFLKVSD